jgi:hypothetical protein
MSLPQAKKTDLLTINNLIFAILVILSLLVINNWKAIQQYITTTTITNETIDNHDKVKESVEHSSTVFEKDIMNNSSFGTIVSIFMFSLVLLQLNDMIKNESYTIGSFLKIGMFVWLIFNWKDMIKLFITNF